MATESILAVILHADVVGSTGLVQQDERVAHDRIQDAFRRMVATVEAFGGKAHEVRGDAVVAEFARASDAVIAALRFQAENAESNRQISDAIRPQVRIGIALGEVVIADRTVTGAGVVLAQRLEQLAAPDGVTVQGAIYETVPRRLPLAFEFLGEQILKGFDEAVRAYAVTARKDEALPSSATTTAAGSPTVSGVVPETAVGEPLLAVLAFDNLSSDPEMQFFSDGVSEDIIQRLTRGAALKVIGRTSSFQFRGERKADAAQSLKCTHILDGSIQRAAGRVRISAHLVEASSRTTLWSDRYDGSLEDVFAVQDEISENIAKALHQAFSRFFTATVDPAVYDLYLRASLTSYAPDELRTNIGLLEVATQRAPDFTEAWARLAYSRAWLRFYLPFAERAASAALVTQEADRALAQDPQNVDALAAKLFVIAPFSRFLDFDAGLARLREAPGVGDSKKYIGWFLRTVGRVREALAEDEASYRADALDPMCANLVALARMAAGRVEQAVPVFEDLMVRVPEMSFPVSSLLRARAFLEDWAGVDELMIIAQDRPLREFVEGLAFIRAKRDPTPANIGSWRQNLETHVSRTGWVDAARLVYAAHLGLVDEAYRAAESARLGPAGTRDDIMGPDGYRTSLFFQAGMPELRNDPRFVRLCARLGLVEFWLTTGKWPDCADEVAYDFKAECAKLRQTPKEDFGF